jgi:DNA-binding response OmpR family regulator
VQHRNRILVIEPDDLILGLLERWLGEAGYAVIVEEAQNFRRALREEREPNLVIIDVPRPRDAGTIIQSIRQVYAGPILLLSARFRRGTSASNHVACQLGVRKVLSTPFTRGELLSSVGESMVGQ